MVMTEEEKKKARNKRYYQKNKKKLARQNKEYRQANKEKIKEYKQNNKEKRKEYRKQRRKVDPKFKLTHNIRNAIGRSLKGSKNGSHWELIVGYTLKQLKKHLEKQFIEGMTWKTYGINGWVIDHKIPISVFNFKTPEHSDFKRCWALKNLQPMWAKENMKKHAKLYKHFQPSLLF